MEKTFKKITMGFFSVLLMSMMLVSAAYPLPFVSNNEANVAIVYGASAALTDIEASQNLVNSLAGGIIIPEDVVNEDVERILSDGVTEDEVELGSTLPEGKIKARLTDNKIPSLFDGKIDWHDGNSSHSYNVHEEILIGDLKLETTLDNNDFEGVVLINDKGLEYRYVFDDDFDVEGLDNDDAESLEVTILGKEYLIEEIDGDSITITLAENAIVQEGASVVIEGITLTVDSIYDNGVFINGVSIKEFKRKTINGIQVKVEEVYYRDSDTRPSKVELYYGGEISEEYSDGEAYIGEDDDDPEWVWSIETDGDNIKYIGVRYDLKQVDEEDDVVYEGGEYVFPNEFAIVSFDSLTEVEYQDYEVFFDDVDLYSQGKPGENVGKQDDIDVVIIQGENDDSFELLDGVETDTLYLRKTLQDNGTIEVYYMDLAEDFSTGKPVWLTNFSLSSTYDISSFATLIVDETEFNVTVSMYNESVSNLFIGDINISLGNNSVGDFKYLGLEDEDAESNDIIVDGKSIGMYDNDVMDYYGTIIENPEDNADEDIVVLRIPSEQVYAQISVGGSEIVLDEQDPIVVVRPTPTELNITKITDGQVATTVGKNLIVVGGPCINTLAADLLGGKSCGVEFTAKTGVGAGQVLIQTFDRGAGNIITLVAGYNAADTQRGVAHLLNNNPSIAIGDKVII